MGAIAMRSRQFLRGNLWETFGLGALTARFSRPVARARGAFTLTRMESVISCMLP